MILDSNAEAGNAGPEPEKPIVRTTVHILLEFLRENYRPAYRRGNTVVSETGEAVPAHVGIATMNSKLIDRLAAASDAPTVNGAVRRDSLPNHVKRWARVAWGDLLGQLPDEDHADLGALGPAREEFRRLVRDALLAPLTLDKPVRLGGGAGSFTKLEKRPLIDWARMFAKPGNWQGVRGLKFWCKTTGCGDELRLRVALRQELFAQIKADRRLIETPSNKFTRRATRYGVGRSGGQDDRPGGAAALVLTDEFLNEMLAGDDGRGGGGEDPEGPRDAVA